MLVLDTQLLVLLAVGATSPRLIEKHKNTHQFDQDDYDLLQILLGRAQVRLLPNVVTEASNLLRQHKPPERHAICATLHRLVNASQETYISSSTACEHVDYVRLGLTDAALIIGAKDDVLLTADARLCLTAELRGVRAINFNHERERFGLV